MPVKIFGARFIDFPGHKVNVLPGHFLINMSQVIPDRLQRYAVIVEPGSYGMTVVMALEQVFSVLNVIFIAIPQHLFAKSPTVVSSALSILKHIVICLDMVFLYIYLHELVYCVGDRDALVGAHFRLIYLNPCIPPLYVIGVAL